MNLPEWAFPDVSARLPEIRQRDEGQDVEFKEDFPKQAHNLGSEIAALATSGGSTILIGVHNNGDVSGLEVATEDDRDDVIHRAQNIVRTVEPGPDGP
jgi:predicted HTH transcriptional regulator